MVKFMKPLRIWNKRIQDMDMELVPVASRVSYGLKKSPRYYATKTNFILITYKAQPLSILSEK